jgi:hypothetical protein
LLPEYVWLEQAVSLISRLQQFPGAISLDSSSLYLLHEVIV